MCANKIALKTPNESRKIRKPLMEKKRRARINDCLEELKKLLIHNKRECVPEVRPSKLEKADILEQTVIFMKKLVNDPVRGYNQGFIDSEERTKSKLAAYENLNTNEKQRLFSYLFNENRFNTFTYEKCFLNHQNFKENVWRPW